MNGKNDGLSKAPPTGASTGNRSRGPVVFVHPQVHTPAVRGREGDVDLEAVLRPLESSRFELGVADAVYALAETVVAGGSDLHLWLGIELDLTVVAVGQQNQAVTVGSVEDLRFQCATGRDHRLRREPPELAHARGENAWADELRRYPTPHPAEGRDDDPHVSSEWALAWDDDHLYLAVDVVDELVEAPYADEPHLLFRGDGINFTFGQPPDGLADDAPLRDDDVQIMIGPASGDADTAVAGVQFASGDGTTCPDGRVFADGRDEPEVTATSRATVDGYQLAAAVPWSLLGHEPEADGFYGIIFTVADVDGSEPFARHASRSSHADRPGAKHCPARWQTLALAPG